MSADFATWLKMASSGDDGDQVDVGSSRSVVYHSPMGPLKLTATEEGMAAVKYLFGKHADEKAEKQADEGVGVKWSEEVLDGSEAGSHLKVCCEWLDAYFAGKLLSQDPPPPPKPKLALSKKGSFEKNLV